VQEGVDWVGYCKFLKAYLVPFTWLMVIYQCQQQKISISVFRMIYGMNDLRPIRMPGSWVRIQLDARMSVCFQPVCVEDLQQADPPTVESYCLRTGFRNREEPTRANSWAAESLIITKIIII
jgi:hypothetical protein